MYFCNLEFFKMRLFNKSIIALFFCFYLLPAQAQKNVTTTDINSVYTAVPFLTIAPDSRSAAMGDVAQQHHQTLTHSIGILPNTLLSHQNKAMHFRIHHGYKD